MPNTNDDPLQPDGGSYEIANDRPVIRFSASRRFYATERKREKERERERERENRRKRALLLGLVSKGDVS